MSLYCNSDETFSGKPCHNRVSAKASRCKDNHHVVGGSVVSRETTPGIITRTLADSASNVATLSTLDSEFILEQSINNEIHIGENLTGMNFEGKELSDAVFKKSNLSNAKFRDADLSKASLRGANLQGSDLSDADLSAADLRGANLSEANLTGADLSSAKFDKKTIFSGARFDGGTILPSGMNIYDLGLAPRHDDQNRFSFSYR